jgi:hypothetical protein
MSHSLHTSKERRHRAVGHRTRSAWITRVRLCSRFASRLAVLVGLDGTRENVPECETAAVFEDATSFAVEALLVGHVHLCVLAPDDVEGRVGEGELKRVGVDMVMQSLRPVASFSHSAIAQYSAVRSTVVIWEP